MKAMCQANKPDIIIRINFRDYSLALFTTRGAWYIKNVVI